MCLFFFASPPTVSVSVSVVLCYFLCFFVLCPIFVVVVLCGMFRLLPHTFTHINATHTNTHTYIGTSERRYTHNRLHTVSHIQHLRTKRHTIIMLATWHGKTIPLCCPYTLRAIEPVSFTRHLNGPFPSRPRLLPLRSGLCFSRTPLRIAVLPMVLWSFMRL